MRRYNGPGNGYDDARAIAVSPDGSKVFVTGVSRGSNSGEDYTTVAYNASTGVRVWVRRYNGPGNGYDDARALVVRPDGSKVFVTGVSRGSKRYTNYATIAYGAAAGRLRGSWLFEPLRGARRWHDYGPPSARPHGA